MWKYKKIVYRFAQYLLPTSYFSAIAYKTIVIRVATADNYKLYMLQ
jgi:hypothetical protein